MLLMVERFLLAKVFSAVPNALGPHEVELTHSFCRPWLQPVAAILMIVQKHAALANITTYSAMNDLCSLCPKKIPKVA